MIVDASEDPASANCHGGEPKTLRTSASLRRRRQTPRLSGAVYATAHTAIWKEKLDCRSFHACALAGTALGSKWRSVKRCGLVAELTDHLAHDHLIISARLGDADLPDCSHWDAVEGPKIAEDGATLPGRGLNTLGRAISPRTFTSTWIFLGRSFFRPLERCPYDLAPLRSERAQWTATVHREGRLLGWGLRVCSPNSSEAQHRSSRHCEPPGLEHFATLPCDVSVREHASRNLRYPSHIWQANLRSGAGSMRIGQDDILATSRQCECAGLTVLLRTPGPARNVGINEHRAVAALVRR